MLAPALTRPASAADLAGISALHARVFGPGRFARSAYRVREGKGLMSRFCRVAEVDGRIVASVRLTDILIGGESGAALLGPIAVDADHRTSGFGRALINDAIADLRPSGVKLIILVGDTPYYGRYGFVVVPPGQMTFPGPVDPGRILALELEPGALQSYRGVISAAAASGGGSSVASAVQ